jgi:hypothetical protein
MKQLSELPDPTGFSAGKFEARMHKLTHGEVQGRLFV